MSQPPLSRRELRERERARAGTTRTIITAVVVLLLLVAGVWFGRSLLAPGDAPSGSPTSAATGSTATGTASESPTSPPTSATAADPLAASISACQETWRLQTTAQAAAFTALSQWRSHLDIMNRLQAGKITLAAAKKEWAPTTVGAPANIAAFHAADKAYTDAKVGCVAPEPSVTGPQADGLRTCAASSAKLDGVIRQARIAVAPWETHLKDQSHFKAGQVTSATAEARWRALWKKGLATIGGWVAAQTATGGATCTL